MLLCRIPSLALAFQSFVDDRESGILWLLLADGDLRRGASGILVQKLKLEVGGSRPGEIPPEASLLLVVEGFHQKEPE